MDFPTSEATIFLLAREYTRSGHDLSLGVRYTHLIKLYSKNLWAKTCIFRCLAKKVLARRGAGGGGELPYMGYMCCP